MKKLLLYIISLVFCIYTNGQMVPFGFMQNSEAAPPTVLTYNWDSATDKTDEWTWDNPIQTDGLAATSTNEMWSWDEDETPSAGVGPSSGQAGNPDGYVYVESSGSPISVNYSMELIQNIDASAYDVLITFYTNQRGDSNNATCVIQTNEASAGWVNRGTTFGGASDPDKVATSGSDTWILRTVDLTGLISNASTKLRILISLSDTANTFHNDYGIDTITITLTPN